VKKARFFVPSVIALCLSMLVISGCRQQANNDVDLSDVLDGLSDYIADIAESFIEDTISDIADMYIEFEELGLVFDPETLTLFYHDTEVVFFEDIQGETTHTFGNRRTSGLHIRVIRNSDGEVISLDTN
jgi:hypothetical protein